jgi:hypothetical protein
MRMWGNSETSGVLNVLQSMDSAQHNSGGIKIVCESRYCFRLWHIWQQQCGVCVRHNPSSQPMWRLMMQTANPFKHLSFTRALRLRLTESNSSLPTLFNPVQCNYSFFAFYLSESPHTFLTSFYSHVILKSRKKHCRLMDSFSPNQSEYITLRLSCYK